LKSLVHSAAVFNFDPALLWLARQMYPGAAGIAAMSSTETATAERAFERHGKPRPETNRELLAQDWANIREGFLRCMPPEVQRSQTTGEEPVWLFSSETTPDNPGLYDEIRSVAQQYILKRLRAIRWL
jgi:hypothetical protein